MHLPRLLLVTLLLLTEAACSHKPPTASPVQKTLQIYVTVDWEGATLDEENIEAMQAFRQKFPQVPLWHFLNPAYFVKPGMDAQLAVSSIRRTLRPHDHLGLHLHGWQSLMRHCRVPFAEAPSIVKLQEDCEHQDCGYAVSLELAYDTAALSRLLSCSQALMVTHGFPRPDSFRAGGWQAGPKLREALVANGFRVDSSHIDYRQISSSWTERSALVQSLTKLHPGASVLDQPYAVPGGLTQYPNNGSLADYFTPEQLVGYLQTLIAADKQVLVTGFHQETAVDFLHRLETAIPMMEQAAADAGVALRWTATPKLIESHNTPRNK